MGSPERLFHPKHLKSLSKSDLDVNYMLYGVARP